MSRQQQTVVRPRPAGVWLAGAVAGAFVGGLLTALAMAGPAAAAGFSVPVDCAGGRVVLTTDNATYQLQGTCGVVVVKASGTTVDVPSSRKLIVRGHDNSVTARPGDRLLVRGHDNHVSIASTRTLAASSPGSRVVVEGLVERARVSGRDLALRARQVTSLQLAGRGHDVTARRGYDAIVPADRSVLHFRRLDDLDLTGDHDTVVVKRQATTVNDSGRGNTVRVHRR